MSAIYTMWVTLFEKECKIINKRLIIAPSNRYLQVRDMVN